MQPLLTLKAFLATLLILILPAALLVAYFRNYSPGAGNHVHGGQAGGDGGAMGSGHDMGAMPGGMAADGGHAGHEHGGSPAQPSDGHDHHGKGSEQAGKAGAGDEATVASAPGGESHEHAHGGSAAPAKPAQGASAEGSAQASESRRSDEPSATAGSQHPSGHTHEDGPNGGGEPAKGSTDYLPVTMPNVPTLPWKLVDGVKVFHLIAEPVQHEFAPGLIASCWGYNGSTPGPLIEAVEGDHVRIYVSNRLPEPTTVHWHGILLPNGMDGVSGLTQKPIAPGETFAYEFTLNQHGTLMYHPHFDEMTQMGMGLMGMFIIHPKQPPKERVDREYGIMLTEWFIQPGTTRPNPMVMTDFNLATFNSRAFPGTEPLVAKTGDRVRVHFGNLSAMDHHPIHLHGHAFTVVETDGGLVPPSAQWPETTVLVPVGSTRTIEFIADSPGDWAFHCHMTHHVMNQMGHDVPNMIGVDPTGLDESIQRLLPGYMTMGVSGMAGMVGMAMPRNSIAMMGGEGPFSAIDMGGMLTVIKIRDDLSDGGDPGWYEHPNGTVALPASAEQMRHDGIVAPDGAPASGPAPASAGHHH